MAGTGNKAARSIRSLARIVGRSESAVRKWMGRDDWPFNRVGPWDKNTVEKVRAWAEIQLKHDPAAAYRKKQIAAETGSGEFSKIGAEAKTRIQANIERTLFLRQRREERAGKLHDAEVCRQRRLRQIHAVKSTLLALPRSIAASLEGQDRSTIERLLTERITSLCREFSGEVGQ